MVVVDDDDVVNIGNGVRCFGHELVERFVVRPRPSRVSVVDRLEREVEQLMSAVPEELVRDGVVGATVHFLRDSSWDEAIVADGAPVLAFWSVVDGEDGSRLTRCEQSSQAGSEATARLVERPGRRDRERPSIRHEEVLARWSHDLTLGRVRPLARVRAAQSADRVASMSDAESSRAV